MGLGHSTACHSTHCRGRSVHCTWACTEVCVAPVHALLVARHLPLECVSASTGNGDVVAYVLTLQCSLVRPARAPHTSAFVFVWLGPGTVCFAGTVWCCGRQCASHKARHSSPQWLFGRDSVVLRKAVRLGVALSQGEESIHQQMPAQCQQCLGRVEAAVCRPAPAHDCVCSRHCMCIACAGACFPATWSLHLGT